MLENGQVLRIGQSKVVIAEVRKISILVFPCSEEGDGQYEVDFEHPQELPIKECHASPNDGRVSDVVLNTIKRKVIFSKIEEFYYLFHKSAQFTPCVTKLKYSAKVYGKEEMVSLVDAALDFWLTSGRYADALEKKLANYLGRRYALLVNSGSSANLLAISALTSPKLGTRRLKPGDEVVTVAAGFPTTVAPIVQNHLTPVFVDVDLGTYNVNTSMLEQAVSPKTKAIILAHTMGNPFDVETVMRIAKQHNLWVIEDNCDALGSRYKGQLTGSFGDIATSSFYPPHHITMGEGGAVYTNNSILKVVLESLRDWGRDCWCASGCDNTCGKRYGWRLGELPEGYDHKYTYSHLGFNLKVTDLQAAIGYEQLDRIDDFTNVRIRNFERLRDRLQCITDFVILPEATNNSVPSWFGFLITIRDGTGISRDRVVQYLESRNIQTRMLFAGNITKQPAFSGVSYRTVGELESTDKIMMDTFVVGVYPGLNDEMIDYVAEQIIRAIREPL